MPIKPEEVIAAGENAVRSDVGSGGIPTRPEIAPVKPDDKPILKPDDKKDSIKPPAIKPPDDKVIKPPPVRPPGKSTEELYKTGTELYLKGDFPGAEAAYKQILAVDRGNAAAHKGLGFLYQRTNQKPKALAEYRLYLRLNPNAKDAALMRKRIQDLEQ